MIIIIQGMPKPFEFTVERVSWAADQSGLRSVSIAVFVEEQGVPREIDWNQFVIFRCVVGSRAFGLDTDASDIDRRGMAVVAEGAEILEHVQFLKDKGFKHVKSVKGGINEPYPLALNFHCPAVTARKDFDFSAQLRLKCRAVFF